MVPYTQDVIIACNNNETGKIVRPKCSVACIACKLCVKACPEDAIDFENNLASINYDKCTQCYICVENCPTKAIEGKIRKEKRNSIVKY
jgi:Na+-translocating ferredoxin:NAD+ oxidoreductase subunit B